MKIQQGVRFWTWIFASVQIVNWKFFNVSVFENFHSSFLIMIFKLAPLLVLITTFFSLRPWTYTTYMIFNKQIRIWAVQTEVPALNFIKTLTFDSAVVSQVFSVWAQNVCKVTPPIRINDSKNRTLLVSHLLVSLVFEKTYNKIEQPKYFFMNIQTQ